MDVPHIACVGTAMGQVLGSLGAWTSWFVAAGMWSSSEAAGRLVLSLAQLVTVALLPMFHTKTQHRPKKWEIWSNTFLCISLLPGEWLHPEPLACAGPFLPISCVRGKDVHHSRTPSWAFKSISQPWCCCSYATRIQIQTNWLTSTKRTPIAPQKTTKGGRSVWWGHHS